MIILNIFQCFNPIRHHKYTQLHNMLLRCIFLIYDHVVLLNKTKIM